MLTGIPAGDLDAAWPIVAPMLARAVVKSPGDYDLDDIRAMIAARDAQLWVWIENGEITAACVTWIVCYPRRKVCGLPFIGGKHMAHWIDAAFPVVADWARAQGCTQMEGYGRKGWLRVLKDWRVVWHQIRRDI